MILHMTRFTAQRKPLWQEYERMLQRIEEDNAFTLDIPEIKRLRFLQDSVAADLTKVSTFSADPVTIEYLENLVARGFGVIHENRSRERLKINLFAFMAEFARVFRKHILLFYIISAAMLAGSLFGGLSLALNPQSKEIMMPFSHLLGDPSERVAMEENPDTQTHEGQGTFAAQLMVNNIRVSILSFSLGIFYGVLTIFITFYNGIILGAVAVDYIMAGESVFLLAWLLPHGSVEIPAILFAGQGGLLLAKTIIFKDGRLPLSLRLRQRGPELLTLLGGVSLLLIWAGIVESFLSQYHEPAIPYIVKILFGTMQLTGLLLFLQLAGRSKQQEHAFSPR